MEKPLPFAGFFLMALLAGAPAFAQFSGSDDFSDGILDTNKWIVPLLSGANLVETNGQLLIQHTGEVPAAQAFTYAAWLAQASASSNWLAQVDLSLPFFSLSCTQRVELGLIVVKSPPDDPELPGGAVFGIYNIAEPDPFLCPVYERKGRRIQCTTSREGGDSLDRAEALIVSTLISFRLRWDATHGVMMGEYDANGPIDGYQWTVLSTRHLSQYGWGTVSQFRVVLYSRTEQIAFGITNGVGFDNFRATYFSAASAAPALGMPSQTDKTALVPFQSAPQTSYTLEAKGSLGALDWQPVQTVVGDGSPKVLVDNPVLDSTRFYRLRLP